MSSPVSQFLRIVTVLASAVACSASEAPAVQRLSVSPLTSPAGPNSAEPYLSLAGGERLILSWLERDSDSATVSMRLATLDSAGAWSASADIIRAKDLFVNWADFPSVVPLASGKLLAHWLQRNGTGRYSYDVRLSESADGGRTWSPSTTAHAPGIPAEHGFVTLLPRADSTADILFLNGSPAPVGTVGERGPPMRLAMSRWTTAGAVAGPEEILDLRTCDCCQTAAAVTSRGPVVLYRDRSESETRDIYLRRFVDGAWTEAKPLHADGWVIDACPVNGPAIAAKSERVAAVWFTGARDTAKVQLVFSADAGATFGAPIRIDGGMPLGRVDVELLDGGDALVTWIERMGKDSADVRARIVRTDGTVEPALTVSPLSGGRASGFPRMVRRGDGIVLAWTVPGAASEVRLASITIAPR